MGGMMKAYLFVETGEVRCPKRGEYIALKNGGIEKAGMDYRHDKYDILTRHEIDIPEGATGIQVDFQVNQPKLEWAGGPKFSLLAPGFEKAEKWERITKLDPFYESEYDGITELYCRYCDGHYKDGECRHKKDCPIKEVPNGN